MQQLEKYNNNNKIEKKTVFITILFTHVFWETKNQN